MQLVADVVNIFTTVSSFMPTLSPSLEPLPNQPSTSCPDKELERGPPSTTTLTTPNPTADPITVNNGDNDATGGWREWLSDWGNGGDGSDCGGGDGGGGGGD